MPLPRLEKENDEDNQLEGYIKLDDAVGKGHCLELMSCYLKVSNCGTWIKYAPERLCFEKLIDSLVILPQLK